MEASWYFVVYEKSKEALGQYGARLWQPFESKEQYESGKYAPSEPYCVPIHIGVTEVEAVHLVALTPEICELAEDVRDMQSIPNHINTYTTMKHISFRRRIIKQNGLVRIDASEHVAFLRELASKDEHGKSTRNLKIILRLLSNDKTGEIKR